MLEIMQCVVFCDWLLFFHWCSIFQVRRRKVLSEHDFFLWLNNMGYGCTTFCLLVCVLMDVLGVSVFWLS